MKVKICGMTHPDDAKFAAENGADYIGIIFTPKSKRVVSIAQAKKISAVARAAGAEPVAVFVYENHSEIRAAVDAAEINIIQLHGDNSKKYLNQLSQYKIFYLLSPNQSYEPVANTIPLYDSGAGSGQTFDWQQFSPPKQPWILAGGLNPNNVSAAIRLLNPSIVDVASGVEYENSTRKKPELIKEFIKAAKG